MTADRPTNDSSGAVRCVKPRCERELGHTGFHWAEGGFDPAPAEQSERMTHADCVGPGCGCLAFPEPPAEQPAAEARATCDHIGSIDAYDYGLLLKRLKLADALAAETGKWHAWTPPWEGTNQGYCQWEACNGMFDHPVHSAALQAYEEARK